MNEHELENVGHQGGQDPTCGSAGIQVFKPTYSRRPPLVSQLLLLFERASYPPATPNLLAQPTSHGALHQLFSALVFVGPAGRLSGVRSALHRLRRAAMGDLLNG